MSKTMVLSWDCQGLETARCIEDIDKQRVLAVLKGQNPNKIPLPLSIEILKIRAQANMQRHYEIYLLQTDDDITVCDIVKSFKDAPQNMADLVRKMGHKICSFRADEKENKIS